jgi:Domain of unknown function (DUF4434)/Domain of unknown function (DUF5109)
MGSRRDLMIHAGLALAAAAFPTVGCAAAGSGKPVLSGSFLQLLSDSRGWRSEQWKELFAGLRQLQLATLVLQWVASDDVNFYAPPTPGAQAVLPTLLEMADSAGIRVLIGVIQDTDYWQKIAQSGDQVGAYLADREARLVKVIDDVLPLVSAHRSFGGWFMGEEIDDVNWRRPGASATLYSYVHRLSSYLRLVTPSAPITISGFCNAQGTADQLQQFWQDLLQAAPGVGIVLFQDGVGVHKLTLQALPGYLAAMRSATDSTKRQLWSVVEVFEQTGGPPMNSGPFEAVPASFTRVLSQMKIGAQYAAKLIAFAAPNYMLPATGQAPPPLLNEYLRYLATP